MIEWFNLFTSHAIHIISVGDIQDLAAVFAVAFLTELGIPFPLVLDSVLFLLGYQIESIWVRAVSIVLLLLVARGIGSSVIFWLSYGLGHPLVAWIGRRFPIIPSKLDKLTQRLGIKASFAVAISRLGARIPVAGSAFFLRAPVTVALSRLTPGLLTATSIASGTLRFRYVYFIFGIGMASIFSDCTVMAIGVVIGYGLRSMNLTPPPWLLVIGIVVNLVVVLMLQRLIWRHDIHRPA